MATAAACPNNACGPRFNGSEWEFLHFTDERMGYGKLNPYQPTLRRVTPQERKRRKQAAKKKRENPDGVGKDEKSPQNPDRLPGTDQTACRVMADIAQDSTNDVGSDFEAALRSFDNEYDNLHCPATALAVPTNERRGWL
jgi:hypothetical protein